MTDSVLKNLIDYTLNRIVEIEKKYESTSDRTSQYKKIANKIHKDLTASLSPNTYHAYLTEIRNAIKKTNRKHHALTSPLKRKGYLAHAITELPQYESELKALATLPALTIGNGKAKLKEQLHNELNDSELDNAVDIVEGLLTDHPLVSYLVKSKARREKRAMTESASLSDKSRNVKVYNLPAILERANDMLESKSYTSLAWALAVLTGRRSTEILLRGNFKKVSADKVEFSGQLKKRKGTQKAPYTIPVLTDSDKILKAFKRLRNMPEVEVFTTDSEYTSMDYDQLNKAVNQRASGVLNERAKRLMDDKAEVFKNTRGIYARHCSDTFRLSDKVWSGLNEDEFLKAVLGHESTKEVKHYRQVELKADNADWLKIAEETKEEEEKPAGEQAKQNWRATHPIKLMRESIANFEGDYVMVKARKVSKKSVEKFHDEKLRFWVAENSDLAITQSAIEKNKGNTLASGTGSVDVRVNRGTFQAWVSIVGADNLKAYNDKRK